MGGLWLWAQFTESLLPSRPKTKQVCLLQKGTGRTAMRLGLDILLPRQNVLWDYILPWPKEQMTSHLSNFGILLCSTCPTLGFCCVPFVQLWDFTVFHLSNFVFPLKHCFELRQVRLKRVSITDSVLWRKGQQYWRHSWYENKYNNKQLQTVC